MPHTRARREPVGGKSSRDQCRRDHRGLWTCQHPASIHDGTLV